MTYITPPEGFVFVGHGPGVAAELFEALDEVGGDQYADIRSITGGYHVREEVVQKWQENYAADDADDDTESGATGTEAGDEQSGAADQSTASGQEAGASSEEAPEGPTLESKREEIDEFAAKLDPSLDTTKLPNKQAALDAIAEQTKVQA